MRRVRLFAAISAAALCISMMGNVSMVSMAQESVEAEAETATGSDGFDTDVETDEDVETSVSAVDVEATTQDEVREEIIEGEGPSLTAAAGALEYKDNNDGTVTITKYAGSDAEVVIPEQIDGKKVTGIGSYAFRYCSSLTRVEIPSGVTSIGDSVFSGCSSLVSVNVNADNVNYKSVNGILYDGDMKTLICYPAGISGTAEIPSGVTRIRYNAFEGCSELTNIEIPTSVTGIGSYAFAGCSKLTGIEIPSGVTSIGSEAFQGCADLVSIDVSADNVSYKSINGILYDRNVKTLICHPAAISGTAEIPSSVTSIGTAAFAGCKGLTSIELPSGVTSIGKLAFNHCSSLTSMEIPSGVTSIGDYTFNGCSSLTSIEIPSGVTSIGWYAFYGCSSLTDIEIPTGVTSIGWYAFYECSSLTDVKIPSGVTNIGPYTFFGCSSLTDMEIPSGVTSIGDWAFLGCNNLTLYAIAGSGGETYAKDKNIPFVPLCEETDLSKLIVIADSVTYNEQEQTAELYIQDGENKLPLVKGVHYTDTVKGKEAGTITVTITGKRHYTGEATVSFTVNPLNLKNAFEAGDVVLTATDLEYTGRLQQSTVKVTYKGRTLIEGTDYTLKGNGRKAVGTSWAVVTGTGNYKGTIKIKYAMKKASQSNMMVYTKDKRAVDVRTKGATIQLVTSRVRDGAKIVYSVEQPGQGITVSSGGKVTVKKGTKPGKYRIKVLAESTPYYKATSKYFTVVVK